MGEFTPKIITEKVKKYWKEEKVREEFKVEQMTQNCTQK